MKNIVIASLLVSSIFSAELFADSVGKDFESKELTLNKNGFYYEEVIIITLNKQGTLVKKDKQLYDLNNYLIYPQGDQDNPDKDIRPYKVRRGEAAPKIFLYVELQLNTTYTLEVSPKSLSYENGENIDIGTVSGISISEKSAKYLKYQKTTKLNINADSSIDGELSQNLINTQNNLLNFDLSGKVYLNTNLVEDTSSNNLTAEFNLQHAFKNLNFMFFNLHAGCESTQDLSSKDPVAGLSVKSLIPIPHWLTFTKTYFSPFPEINVGYDIARTTSTNTNVNRFTYGLSWEIPINGKLIFDNTFSCIQDMDNSSNVYGYRDQALYYRMSKDVNLMLVKVQEGRQPPLFEYSRIVTSGISANFDNIMDLIK